MSYDSIYSVVHHIPKGTVATYGQVAALAGRPRGARYAGTALSALPPDTDVPWHRVVNAQGKVSLRGEAVEGLQRRLLEAEGVLFSASGRIDLSRFQAKLESPLNTPSTRTR